MRMGEVIVERTPLRLRLMGLAVLVALGPPAMGGLVFAPSGNFAAVRQRENISMLVLWVTFTISSFFAFYPDKAWYRWQDVSKLIIEQLQQDGRRSYAAIGKAVGLSEAAVRQRVQRLIDGGVMQIVAVTDPMTLGFRRQTMIGIKCEGDLERVADLLAHMDEIDYVVITSGSFDILVEVVCEDDDHLLEILSRVRGVPSVTSTETFVYLKLRKQTYSWGTR